MKNLLAAVFLLSVFPVFCQDAGDFEVRGHVLVKYRGNAVNVIIPEGLRINRIGEKAFSGTSVISVKIPVGVDTIENRAFAGCAFLKFVFFPNSLVSIGYRAFFNCTLLDTINIPRSLRSIEGGAFFNCKSLKELEMPFSLQTIGPRAFSGCIGLQSLTLSRRTKTGEYAFMGVSPNAIKWKD